MRRYLRQKSSESNCSEESGSKYRSSLSSEVSDAITGVSFLPVQRVSPTNAFIHQESIPTAKVLSKLQKRKSSRQEKLSYAGLQNVADGKAGSNICTLTATELSKCKSLFKCLDLKNRGKIKRKVLEMLVIKSLKACNLKMRGNNAKTIANLMLLHASQHADCALEEITYENFQVLFEKYLCDNAQSGNASHVRSSLANVMANNETLPGFKANVPSHSNLARSEFKKFQIWFSNQKIRIYWGLFYLVLNVGSFYWKFDHYCYRRPEVFELSGYGLCIARGMAQVCLLNAFIILLPLCHMLVQSARDSHNLNKYLPLDDTIAFHRIVGYNLIVSGLIHTGGQLYSFVYSVMKAPNDVWVNSALAAQPSMNTPRPSLVNLATSLPGWTGIVLVLISFIATPFTIQKLRQSNFNWFWYSHTLYYPFFLGLLYVHGAQGWLEPTQGWIFISLPLLLFIIDRRNRFNLYSKASDIAVNSIEIDDDAVALTMEKPKTFANVRPGMYLHLNVPELSSFEWHPFTITSAPDDEFVSVNIRAIGDWTTELREIMSEYKQGKRVNTPMVKIDGPVGAPTQDYLNYDVVLMVGSGIGVTPFASILRDTAYRLRDSRCNHCHCVNYDSYIPWNGTRNVLKNFYFHWTTRSQSSLAWFSSCMNDVSELDIDSKIEIHNHLTSLKTNTNDATIAKTMQTLCHRMTGHDIVSGLKTRSRTHFGRPNWDDIFNNVVLEHKNEDVGVFFCGAKAFELQIEAMCRKYSSNENSVRFEFHSEKF